MNMYYNEPLRQIPLKEYKFQSEVVNKKYVIDHPEVTLEELQTIFPRALHGNYELVVDASDPPERFNVIYFYRERDWIDLKDGRKICVTNQWGRPIIGRFLQKAKELGYEITQN